MSSQQIGHLAADVADAKRDQDPGQWPLFAGLDRGEEVRHALFAHAVQLDQVLALEVVDVGDIPYEALLDEHGALPRAHALDIDRAPADEMLDQPYQLRGAARVHAEGDRFVLGADDRLAAARTLVRHPEYPLIARAPLRNDADDLRNHLGRPSPRRPNRLRAGPSL